MATIQTTRSRRITARQWANLAMYAHSVRDELHSSLEAAAVWMKQNAQYIADHTGWDQVTVEEWSSLIIDSYAAKHAKS